MTGDKNLVQACPDGENQGDKWRGRGQGEGEGRRGQDMEGGDRRGSMESRSGTGGRVWGGEGWEGDRGSM